MHRNLKRFGFLTALIVGVGLFAVEVLADGERMRVAEWGTFTVLQNEDGEALPGVNVNEERLPGFVHRLSHQIVPDVSQIVPVSGPRSKGIPASYPYAIMRMETPIIYFYPPPGQRTPLEVDVSVGFRGGWISEWYPNAEVVAPGFKNSYENMGSISPKETGTIQWRGLQVGGDVALPETNEHVWLAPRDVDAARVSASNGDGERENEQYLFYRGVANLDAPLRVLQGCKYGLTIETNGWLLKPTDEVQFSALWVVDIQADGKLAFRELPGVAVAGSTTRQTVAKSSSLFSQMEYSTANRDELRRSMRRALRREGLTAREAEAMLNTWRLSYFQSPGLRLFFTLPRPWTDDVLPLSVSVPAEITRVMIGRIEMVTRKQLRLIQQISAGPISTSAWFSDAIDKVPFDQRSRVMHQLYNEEKTFAELGFKVPADYQAYLDLGRFRDAIVLDQLRRNPTEPLKQFTQHYFIHRFDSPPTAESATTPADASMPADTTSADVTTGSE